MDSELLNVGWTAQSQHGEETNAPNAGEPQSQSVATSPLSFFSDPSASEPQRRGLQLAGLKAGFAACAA